MRVAAEARLVYLNPPRTATTTIDWQLKANRLKLWSPREYAGHATIWKPEWDDWFVFVSVRSPWTRAVSLWRRTVEALQFRTAKERKILKNGAASFEEHLFEDYYQHWWNCIVARQFTIGVPHVDLVVHQERLQEDFNKVPGVTWKRSVRHKKSQDQSPWHEHYTPRCIDRVREVFARDFQEYGYTEDFEKAKAGELFV